MSPKLVKTLLTGLLCTVLTVGIINHENFWISEDESQTVKHRGTVMRDNLEELYSLLRHGLDPLALDPGTIDLLREGARRGDADTQSILGMMHLLGHGVPQDDMKATEWIRKAAVQGNPGGQNCLGLLHLMGHGVTRDESKAAEWFRIAAEQGHGSAQVTLGAMHEEGFGVPQDQTEAASWYRKAAEGRGTGTSSCTRPASIPCWYYSASERGGTRAQYKLGTMYERGKGVTQDYSEAINWYRRAAKLGDVDAQLNLGRMYLEGRRVPRNDSEAIKWLRRAAEQGNARAQLLLGWMYGGGGHGIAQNNAVAYMWLNLGATQLGDNERKIRDGFALGMPAEEISEGQRLSRECLNRNYQNC